jgi:hypothetical protein
MALFRPINSSESNLFTIRVSVGSGSSNGVFNTNLYNISNKIIVSNNSTNVVEQDHLATPSKNNLPNGFYIYYDGSNNLFRITYGKEFTENPVINITPHFNTGTFISSTFSKQSLTGDNNLYIYFIDKDGALVSPSSNGTNNLLGFDLIITGPVKIGITTGNSNRGWALSDSNTNNPSTVYSYLDVNLGSGFSISNSIVISKILRLLNSDGNITSFTANTTLSSSNYTSSIWSIGDNITLNNLTPSRGLVLILFRIGTTINPVINLATGTTLNFVSNLRRITMNANVNNAGSNIILIGTSSTNFITLSMNNITLSII